MPQSRSTSCRVSRGRQQPNKASLTRIGEVDGELTLSSPQIRILEILVGSEHSVLGPHQIRDQLNVSSPVSPIVEDKDGSKFDLRKVHVLLDVFQLPRRQLLERPHGMLSVDDVGGNVRMLEAVALGDFATAIGEAADHEDWFIAEFLSERSEDSVTLNDLVQTDL